MVYIPVSTIGNRLTERQFGIRDFLPSRFSYLVAAGIAAGISISGIQPAFAQGLPGGGQTLLAQAAPVAPVITRTPTSTILPTDLVPIPTIQNRMTFGENLQLRILQKLPARFYFSASCETSFRLETNVFQFPMKRIMLYKLLPTPATWFAETQAQQKATLSTLHEASRFDTVYRVLPSCTGGWTLSPHTRVYGTFFTIRDSLFYNTKLNTDIYSYAFGVQHDFQMGQRGNLQADLQFRELNQMHQHSVFDYLPGLTYSYVVTPRTYAFVNALIQIRGRKYFQAPTRELDPFYTWGLTHQRGRWTFSASSTFVQNFRQPFGHHALIPANNYSMISDFEIDRRIFPQIAGLQAFIRAEPIWNMHAHNRTGLSGMDFRLYYGLRLSVSKPALTSALDSLRKQLEEQETEPPAPTPSTPSTKPSAFISPQELTACRPQPFHGYMSEPGAATATANPYDCPVAIYSPSADPSPFVSQVRCSQLGDAVPVPSVTRSPQRQIAAQEADSAEAQAQ